MNCFTMFITALCVLFLMKLRWPKNVSRYDTIASFWLIYSPRDRLLTKLAKAMHYNVCKTFASLSNVNLYLRNSKCEINYERSFQSFYNFYNTCISLPNSTSEKSTTLACDILAYSRRTGVKRLSKHNSDT